MTTSAAASRSPDRLFLALFALAILIVGGLWFWIQRTIAPSLEVAAQMVATPLPETMRPLYAQRTPSGAVAEFFDSATNHKFSLARAPLTGPTTAAPRDLLNAIIEFQKSSTISPSFAPLSVRFSQALFNGRGAYDVADGSLTIGQQTLPVISFVTTKGAHHALLVMNKPTEQITVLGLRKNAPVDLEALSRFVGMIAPEPQAP